MFRIYHSNHGCLLRFLFRNDLPTIIIFYLAMNKTSHFTTIQLLYTVVTFKVMKCHSRVIIE